MPNCGEKLRASTVHALHTVLKKQKTLYFCPDLQARMHSVFMILKILTKLLVSME